MAASDKNLDSEKQIVEKALDLHKVYDTVGELVRFSLNWRQRILAGYFVLVGSLCVGFSWLHVHLHNWEWLMPGSGVFLTFIFLLLDHRNNEGYRACFEAGAALEKHITPSIEGGGPYQRLAALSSNWRWYSHRVAFSILFGLALMFFFILTLYLIIEATSR